MLIGFKLRNFRSFAGEQVFTFSTSSDRTHESTHCIRTGVKAVPRLSKAAILFGPNASGKSNLLFGLATLRDLILRSTTFSDTQFAERFTPFKFAPAGGLPTEFEIDVLLNAVRYRYSVSYDSQRIRAERLLVYRTGKSQRWFERRFDEVTQTEQWTTFSPNFSGAREMWRKATRSNALFLTTAAQLNCEQFKPLLHWFEHGLVIVFPADVADLSRVAAQIKDVKFKARVLSLLRSVDIRIDDVRVVEHHSAPSGAAALRSGAAAYPVQSAARPSIEFLYHLNGAVPVWLDSAFEAAGTHRLFGLFGPLLGAMEYDKLLVIDEFDTSLHPLVARYLIQLISDPRIASRGAQLLLTSHNTTLMDLDILRRDEIWLVELDGTRASNLSSVLRARPRKHELIAKGYLRGRYGAVPVITRDAYGASEPPSETEARP